MCPHTAKIYCLFCSQITPKFTCVGPQRCHYILKKSYWQNATCYNRKLMFEFLLEHLKMCIFVFVCHDSCKFEHYNDQIKSSFKRKLRLFFKFQLSHSCAAPSYSPKCIWEWRFGVTKGWESNKCWYSNPTYSELPQTRNIVC